MKPIQEVMFGSRLEDHLPVIPDGAVVKVKDFGISDSQFSKNILFLGGTGSGKTNAINTILTQIRAQMTADDVMIVFDTKGDFADRFYSTDKGDLILGSSAGWKDKSIIWNIYREVLADGKDIKTVLLNINEIARSLFAGNESESQPFFPNAARGVFSAFLLSMIREGNESLLNNADIVSFFTQADESDYNALRDSAPDMKYIRMYLGDCKNNQALGVIAEVLVMLQDMFVGVFGGVGDFSVREFIRAKGGRTLFLEYDLALGQTLSPLYSLLIDLVFREALSSSSQRGKVWVILDELKLLPKLQHMDDAVNFGRSMGVRVLAGLQSVTQLYDMYDENKGRTIAAGFSSLLAFRANDPITREFISDQFGKNIINETILTSKGNSVERRDGHTVEDWDINGLLPGNAIIGMDGYPPFRFYFDLFS
jgi:type IV secretory pathway TraG/TraD family ATPase VirD4